MAQGIEQLLYALPDEERAWIIGNETSDGLHEAFTKKRVVHAGRGGRAIMNGAAQQSTWRDLMMTPYTGDGRSVYLHIPFCSRKCLYCGFFQHFTEEELIENYTDALVTEIEMTAGMPRLDGRPIEAVYFGGGTPTALNASQLGRIMRALQHTLPLANDCEITLEGRINDLTPTFFDEAVAAGINRFSIGVQSFDTRVRKAVGRIDPEDVVCERLAYMVQSGKAAIIVDLMFGLPHQTLDVWQHDLDTQYALGVHGGDLYQLNIFPGSELHQAIQKGHLPPGATTREQADLFVYALSDMRRRPAIERIDVSHWALGRRERSLYNTLTKGNRDVIAFGCGAGGKLSGYSMMQARTLVDYMDRVLRGEKPIQFMMAPEAHYAFFGDVMRQMEGMYLDNRALVRKWGIPVVDLLRPVLTIWEEKGLVTLEEDIMRMTVAGQFWHDNLIQAVTEMLTMLEKAEAIQVRVDDVARQDEMTKAAKKEPSAAMSEEVIAFLQSASPEEWQRLRETMGERWESIKNDDHSRKTETPIEEKERRT